MSNAVSPRGPLPPHVYWRRRLVVLFVLVGLVVLVGRLLWGGDGTEPVAERGPAGATAPATRAPAAGPGGKPAAEEDSDGSASRRPVLQRRPARATRPEAPPVSLSGAAGPLAQPAGACDVSDVAIVPDVEDTDAGSAVPLRLGLSTGGRHACTFSFAADTVALRITSGDDLIWETLKCERAIEEQSVVVRPGWLTYVTVAWSGRRDDEGCAQTGEFASPGYYWAEAAPVGGEPQRSQFELETPPPPPEPKPKRPADKPADDARAEATPDAPRPGRTRDDTARQDDGGRAPERAGRDAGAAEQDRDRTQRPERDGEPAGGQT